LKPSRLLPVTFALLMTMSLPAWARVQTIKLTPRTFTGAITLAGDTPNFSGTLTALKPTCQLTVASNSRGIANGVGPNNSLLLNGSEQCAGSFQLFISSGTLLVDGPLGTPAGGIGSNSGVYTGTFAIVDVPSDPTQQGTKVEWAGNFTQVYNIDPDAFGCGSMNFCANLSAPDAETFNGSGLSYLLELQGFSWTISK
jgi:hypothetical protein